MAGDDATAALLALYPLATVAALGDNAYEDGTASEYQSCYGPSWGLYFTRTRPAPGNHDYGTANAAGYFGYFGSAAGPQGKGWYSYNLGSWHVVVLNSNCSYVACGAGSAQEQWLRADLAANRGRCTLAYYDYRHRRGVGSPEPFRHHRADRDLGRSVAFASVVPRCRQRRLRERQPCLVERERRISAGAQ
jgi:hypothetical protein